MRLLLSWDGQRIVAASIAATRPLAARILIGQPPDKAVALVPRLFSLCGQAQGIAAQLAWLAARGEQAAPEALAQALRSVALEAIGEHLWRLLLDWPPLLGQPVRKEEFLAWRKRLLMVADSAAAAKFGSELNDWLDREHPLSLEQAPALAQGPLLPWLSADQWAQQTIDDAFASLPSYAGQAAETGALARQIDNTEVAALWRAGLGVAARLAARYADLRKLADGLIEPTRLAGWLDAAPAGVVGATCGLARVETARGVLLHFIETRDDKVARYVIVAPTEWNFHPQGAFLREIVGSPATTRAQAESSARCLVLALDPCVAYALTIQETNR